MSTPVVGRLSGAASKVAQLARVSAGLGEFLATPVGIAAAGDRLRARVEAREARFLDAARLLIYEHRASPYRQLLEAAGCGCGDLQAMVRERGLEPALEELHRAGVYVTLDELKARRPIVRNGVPIEAAESDFDSPLLLGRGVPGRTSGSRSRGTRVSYDWFGLAEEADNQLILDAVHGVDAAPLALWFPGPPGVGGIRNVLLAAKCSRPPERWFSQSHPDWGLGGAFGRAAVRHIARGGARAGVHLPRPEYTPPEEAVKVTSWLAGEAPESPRTIRTMTSSALRVVGALPASSSLAGRVMLVGGEPLGEERRRLLESSGARVVNRYATAEAGIAAAACGREPDPDAMHLYSDRVAAIEREPGLLLTSLSRYTGKVLLNASLGDRGALFEQACDCTFGRLGMHAWITGLGSDERLTVEGMTVRLGDVDAIVGRLMRDSGARPGDYQLRTRVDGARGLARLRVTVSPRLAIDPEWLHQGILRELAGTGPIGALTAQVWEQAAALEIVKAEPQVSAGHKLLPVVRER